MSEKNIPTLTTPDDPTVASLLPEGDPHEEDEKPEAPFAGRPRMALDCWLSMSQQASQLSLVEFCWYASSAGSNHIKLLQAAYKIKTIAMP